MINELLPIYGWRFFFKDYIEEGAGLRGYSGKGDCRWIGLTKTARCSKYRTAEVEILLAKAHLQEGTCTCGIYLKLNQLEFLQYMRDTYSINRIFEDSIFIAYCKGWGLTVEGETGIRCENVEILKLYGNYKNTPNLFRSAYSGPVDTWVDTEDAQNYLEVARKLFNRKPD